MATNLEIWRTECRANGIDPDTLPWRDARICEDCTERVQAIDIGGRKLCRHCARELMALRQAVHHDTMRRYRRPVERGAY